MRKTRQCVMLIAMCITLLLSFQVTAGAGSTEKDKLDYYYVNSSRNTIVFDSERGPYYLINYRTKKIIDCTSSGAKIKKCTVSGNILTLVLYSDELPVNSTYTFNLLKNLDTLPKDRIEYYRVNPSKSIIEFDSDRGPYYKIDYLRKKILDCTSGGASIIKCKKDGNTLRLVLFSYEYPKTFTYSFDLSKNINGIDGANSKDSVDYYKVYPSYSIIEFDSKNGPYYEINYKEGKILDCTSYGAEIRSCTVNGNKLTLKLYSAELPKDTVYTFDLRKYNNSSEPYIPERDYNAPDTASYYLVHAYDNIIEFDSDAGPYYTINYKTGEILFCTSEGAKLTKCAIKNNKLFLTLYSSEYPVKTTYDFDLTKNIISEDTLPDRDNIHSGIGTDSYSYLLYKGSAVIESYDKNTTKLVIPDYASWGSYRIPVISVSKDAFRGKKKISALKIGSNVSSIGDGAFMDCTNLKVIKIMSTKLSAGAIADNAFKNVNAKVRVICPSGMKEKYREMLLTKGIPETAVFE